MKKPVPTKDEVKAARVAMRDARRVLRAAGYPKRHRHRRYIISASERAFRTWEHDFETFLGSRSDLPPKELLVHAEAAADRMRAVVDARRKEPIVFHAEKARVSERLRLTVTRSWEFWFDRMVHALCDHTSLSPGEVIERASKIADLAIPILARKAKGWYLRRVA